MQPMVADQFLIHQRVITLIAVYLNSKGNFIVQL